MKKHILVTGFIETHENDDDSDKRDLIQVQEEAKRRSEQR